MILTAHGSFFCFLEDCTRGEGGTKTKFRKTISTTVIPYTSLKRQELCFPGFDAPPPLNTVERELVHLLLTSFGSKALLFSVAQ